VDDQPFAVPDDLSTLCESPRPDAADRAASREHSINILRRALVELGVLVPAGQFPHTGVPVDGQDADVEQGILAGMLTALGERAALGADLADVAAGYEFAARDIDGDHTARSEDRWRQTIRRRAQLTAALARLPYPPDVAPPNEVSSAADAVVQHAAQAAVHAATVRLLLQIPADVFAGSPSPAISSIRESIGALIVTNYAVDIALRHVIRLLPPAGTNGA
jgi:hypothetical protein